MASDRARRFRWGIWLRIAIASCALGSRTAHAEPLLPTATAWRDSNRDAIRGVTIGPIENTRHPDRGYGSQAYARAVDEAKRMGATWVSLTPFGRILDLRPSGIDPSFEARFEDNRRDVLSAIAMAHAAGLRVLLVPHLWVESGEWRALVDPGDDAAWTRWAEAYVRFVDTWARVSEEGSVDMMSVGVEQRSFVTTARAPLYDAVIATARQRYHGLLAYSANWDDVEETSILGDVDVIGINAFYPLADKDGATLATQLEGGRRIAARVEKLAKAWQKPVMFSEIGYTTRENPAVKPWEWPDAMKNVVVDERAQAEAYLALLAPMQSLDSFAGFFVWRLYADPDDISQEAEWGFSPRGKLAELVMRDAFSARWAADGEVLPGSDVARFAAEIPGFYEPRGSLLP